MPDPGPFAAFRLPVGGTILNDSISAANRIRQLSNPALRSARVSSFPLVLPLTPLPHSFRGSKALPITERAKKRSGRLEGEGERISAYN